ncbi:MAG: hypothetical protein JSV43_03780 [Methanobacteriota archaeon]|nr:MAG: hypothetical protein JSV43_03780 [Euryarchaeota archaeon]
MGTNPIPPIPQKKESALMHSEGEEADPKRRMKLFVRLIILIVVLVILFSPVWEVEVTAYSVIDKSVSSVTYHTYYDSWNCTRYDVEILDRGAGGWYRVEFHVQNSTFMDSWRIEPYESRVHSAFSCEVHADDFTYTVYPPEVRQWKSLFQIMIGA